MTPPYPRSCMQCDGIDICKAFHDIREAISKRSEFFNLYYDGRTPKIYTDIYETIGKACHKYKDKGKGREMKTKNDAYEVDRRFFPDELSKTSEADEENWKQTDLFCPFCGKKSVLVEQSEGDYYCGSEHLCKLCNTTFCIQNIEKETEWIPKEGLTKCTFKLEEEHGA